MYQVETFSTAPVNFFAGDYPIAKAKKEAAAAITARTPVVIGSDGKVKPIALVSGAVSTTGLYGIAAHDAASGSEVAIYLTGEFFGAALTMPTGITAADLEVAFRAMGIFIE